MSNSGSTHNLASSSSSMTVDEVLRDLYGDNPAVATENTLLDAEVALVYDADANSSVTYCEGSNGERGISKTVDDVWREIAAGRSERNDGKMEAPQEMMTLEDFLAKAVAVEKDVKAPVSGPMQERLSGGFFAFDPIGQSQFARQTMVEHSVVEFANEVDAIREVGRGKRRRGPMVEALDKAAQQRQRRMIKNRESAARSRERKQAYQEELESLVAQLEEENEQLHREKVERTKQRFKQLLEKVIPIVEKRRPVCVLKRVRSVQW